MTKAEIREKIRRKLGDDEFDGTIIDEAVNDYIYEICTRNEFRFDEAEDTSFTILTGNSTITLPSNFRKLLHLYVTTDDDTGDVTDLEKDKGDIDRMRLDTPVPTGKPGCWNFFGNTIRFSTDADKDHTLKMHYIKKPTTLTNESDEPLIPEQYQECIVLGGLERVHRTEDDYGLSANERIILSGLETSLIHDQSRNSGSNRGRVLGRF